MIEGEKTTANIENYKNVFRIRNLAKTNASKWLVTPIIFSIRAMGNVKHIQNGSKSPWLVGLLVFARTPSWIIPGATLERGSKPE